MANALTKIAQRLGLVPTVMNAAEVEVRDSSGIMSGIGGATEAGWSVINGNVETEFLGRGTEVRTLGFERHPIVQACVRVIADIVATVDWEVYRKALDGEVTVLEQSPAIQLLNSPRVGMNRLRLRALTAVHYLIYGNAFWVLERNTPEGLPKAIRLVHPENVYYTWLDVDTQEIIVYEWRDRWGGIHKTLATDMVHFRDLAAGDWLFGYPRAAAALIDISADYEAGQFVRQIVMNNGTPSLAIMLEGAVTREQLTAGEERWHEKMARRGGRGRTAFLAGVKDVKQFAFNMRDLEFTALRGIAREDICAVFGVDPRMIAVASARGQEGGLSGVQYREARFRLIQQTILPIMGAMEAVLDDWFAPEFGDVYVRFNPDSLSALTENEVETSDRTCKELAAGLITRNEARSRIGMPDSMDETDVLVGTTGRSEYLVSEQFDHATGNETNALAGPLDPNAPPATVPAGTGPAPTPDSATAAEPPLEKAPAEGSPGPTLPAKAAKGAGAPEPRSKLLRRGIALSPAQRRGLWTATDTRARKGEGAYKRAATALFHAEKLSVRRVLESAGTSRGTTAPLSRHRRDGEVSDPHIEAALRRINADYKPGGDYHQAWLDRYQQLISTTVNAAGEDVAATAGVDFTLENPLVQAAILDRATNLATNVGATTADQITAAVAAGRAAGMGIGDIADLIDAGVFGGGSAMRSARIARTETIGALNQGEYVAAKDSGVIQSCEWLTDGDNLVRESHAEQDGERIDIGDTFSNGLMFPGDQNGDASEVINCRCTLLYHDEDASSES